MDNQEKALSDLRQTLVDFENVDSHENIRDRVLSLVPAVDALRELGKSLISEDLTLPARDRLLKYFRLYPLTVLNHKELAIVAGISDWPRRVRELRADLDLGSMGPKDYDGTGMYVTRV